jgi:actin-related protein
MAAANKIAGIETLRNDFNKSILHSCGSSRIHALKPALEPELTRI